MPTSSKRNRNDLQPVFARCPSPRGLGEEGTCGAPEPSPEGYGERRSLSPEAYREGMGILIRRMYPWYAPLNAVALPLVWPGLLLLGTALFHGEAEEPVIGWRKMVFFIVVRLLLIVSPKIQVRLNVIVFWNAVHSTAVESPYPGAR